MGTGCLAEFPTGRPGGSVCRQGLPEARRERELPNTLSSRKEWKGLFPNPAVSLCFPRGVQVWVGDTDWGSTGHLASPPAPPGLSTLGR